MPVSNRISDSELRQRLEDHAYNVPPITDSTRRTLINKLSQLDQAKGKAHITRKPYSGLDYSSAEEEEFPAPRASSTVLSGARGRGGAGGGGATTNGGGKKLSSVETGGNRRGVRNSRQNSRAGTPQSNGGTGRGKEGGGGGAGRTQRRNVGLMHNSENEEGSEEEEEEEEDICEDEEEEEEEEESEEEDMNGGTNRDQERDRVDLAVQTSLLDSPSPSVTTGSQSQSRRFRGQAYSSAPPTPTTPSSNTPLYSSTPAYPLSPYLRHRINNNSSLGEALATLPPTSKTKTPVESVQATPVTTQTPPQRSGCSHRQNSSRVADQSLSATSKTVSSFIMFAALLFFLVLAWKYFTLVPTESVTKSIPICGSSSTGRPHHDCIPPKELNDTVSLYKSLMGLLPVSEGCTMGEESKVSTVEIVSALSTFQPVLQSVSVEDLLRNLVLLLRQNPGWGITVSGVEVTAWEETTLSAVSRPLTWICWLSNHLTWLKALVISLAGAIMWGALGLLVMWIIYCGYSRILMRKERERREVFCLVDQATDLLLRQHTMVSREGKGGPSYLAIDHIRDQLIPPQDRKEKAAVWAQVVAYIRTNESRIREDVQQIFGEEFRVWQWLPDLAWSPGCSPQSPRTSAAASPQIQANQWPHVSTTTVPGWQGEAFMHNKQVGAPVAPPTSCLKVRHMFDVLHQPPGWVASVKEEIVRRCSQAKIVHIAVDTQSEEGTVYIKTPSTEEAGKVFGCLHGQWYRGQLVTAKYLRLERYHERFPDSKNSVAPLKPN